METYQARLLDLIRFGIPDLILSFVITYKFCKICQPNQRAFLCSVSCGTQKGNVGFEKKSVDSVNLMLKFTEQVYYTVELGNKELFGCPKIFP